MLLVNESLLDHRGKDFSMFSNKTTWYYITLFNLECSKVQGVKAVPCKIIITSISVSVALSLEHTGRIAYSLY